MRLKSTSKELDGVIGESIKGRVSYDEPMAKHTSFRVGGPADIWVEPKDIDDIRNCVKITRDAEMPPVIIGRGTNILVRDEGVRGIVINMSSPLLKKKTCDGNKVTVSSSVNLKELNDFCRDKGLAGLEFLAGIPGSVGGAVITNAAARHYKNPDVWHSFGDAIEEIKILDYEGNIRPLNRGEFKFSFKSFSLCNSIILDVKFLLNYAKRDEIETEYRMFLDRKKKTQDLSLASAGCIFRNPAGADKSAGTLIDECGLKGRRIGGAEISRIHANFIVNTGKAKASDVLALIDLAKKRVKDRFGIDLSLEIKIV